MAAPSPKRLVTAIKKGDVENASKMIRAGVDCTKLVEHIPLIGWTIFTNQPEILELMLEVGCDVEAPNSNHSTPLQYCASIRSDLLSDEDSVRIAEILVANGADIMACENQSHLDAPLALANMRGKKNLARLLESKGALAFNIELTMCDEQSKPLTGTFDYGMEHCSAIREVVGPSGTLLLEHVFPGKLIIRHNETEKQITITKDGSVEQNEVVWSV